ncbi:hypothetical protein I5907_16430 [Panacibacter sp. DH6]|uniref:DUF4450 domain-containing protein n=1 Tax=Panacibacter microcysteis TaxID=2793269 RepID=A0A931E9T3_9BACT|nr:hypothetical protein [Panacibacter microcysteis]MBG9377828.1 hypothetical protein [Panacibacter microcysteis]
MKMTVILFVTIFTISTTMQAQRDSITGVYELTGINEVASGFKLNTDSSFEFYFSYGALDRSGSGKWRINGDKIIFNSAAWPGRDFRLIQSEFEPGAPVTIIIKSQNNMLLPYVYGYADEIKNNEYPVNANSHGEIRLKTTNADSLHLLFEFVPERVSSFKTDTHEHNIFTFTFEAWLFEFFFNNLELSVMPNALYGKHPLLQKEDCTFEKVQ